MMPRDSMSRLSHKGERRGVSQQHMAAKVVSVQSDWQESRFSNEPPHVYVGPAFVCTPPLYPLLDSFLVSVSSGQHRRQTTTAPVGQYPPGELTESA